MRDTPNVDDANLALRLYDLRREAELRKARATVGRLVAGQPWEKVRPLFDHDHAENAHLRQVTSYWEIVASFVNRGIFHPDVYLDTCGEGVFTLWAFRPHLDRIRAMGRPRFLVETERLVKASPAASERLDAIDRSMAARAAAAKPRSKGKPKRKG